VGRLTSRIPGGAVHVVYNGCDADQFAGAAPAEHPRPYIFSAGRLTEKKGMHFLIEALGLLRGRGVDCDLVIAGSGPEEERLRAQADRLGLAAHVRFEGSAGRARLGALYTGCAAFALATLWEGFGLVNLEAMCCGRAVVATRAGGIPEVVVDGETGLLARAGDAADFAGHLAALLADPERAAEMGRRGRARARTHFAWGAVAARYLASYRPPCLSGELRVVSCEQTVLSSLVTRN
jgi:starch synthase